MSLSIAPPSPMRNAAALLVPLVFVAARLGSLPRAGGEARCTRMNAFHVRTDELKMPILGEHWENPSICFNIRSVRSRCIVVCGCVETVWGALYGVCFRRIGSFKRSQNKQAH